MIGPEHIMEFIFSRRPLTHVLYWLVFFGFSCLYGIGQQEPFLVSVFLELIYLPVQIIASYVFIYCQLPLVHKKKYLLFLLSLILSGYIFYVLVHVNFDYGFGTYLITGHQTHSVLNILTDGTYILRYLADIYMVVFLTAGIKLSKDQIENRRLLESIESEKLKSEYNLLQSKIQPDFVLKALKCIQQSSITDIESTPNIISNLSDVLDYNLYQSQKAEISLEEEIKACYTYILLNLKSADSPGIVEIINDHQSKKVVVPLSILHVIDSFMNLLPLTDVSHSLFRIRSSETEIHIYLKFTIEQKRLNMTAPMTLPKPQNISLLRLHYPGQYTTEINHDETSIFMNLKLKGI